MTMTRTRQSLGSQIEEALNDLVERRIILKWNIESNGIYPIRYAIEDARMVAYYTPGNCAEMLNELGFDIYLGKR